MHIWFGMYILLNLATKMLVNASQVQGRAARIHLQQDNRGEDYYPRILFGEMRDRLDITAVLTFVVAGLYQLLSLFLM